MDRRSFLRLAGASCGALPVGSPLFASEPSRKRPSGVGVLVDTTVCTGCRKCEFACDRQNHLTGRPIGYFESRSYTEPRRPAHDAFTVVNHFANPKTPEGRSFVKMQCMHCNRPACVSACIVGALTKKPEGPITYDAWKCIGCRYCMVACPFQIPAYEYAKAIEPRVRKCEFCYDRIIEGERPACVEICPAEALTFGKREELIDVAHSKIVRDRNRYADHVYGEHEVGGTAWIYLTPADFTVAGLPALPGDPIPERTEKIQHGIFKSFVPPLLLYGLLGLIMHATRGERGDGEESGHES